MSRFGLLLIGHALLVALTACVATPSLSVDLDVAALTLYLGDDQDVTVHIGRTGAGSAAVNLAVDGVPAGVSAALSTTTLSGPGDRAALALHADTSAPPSTATVRIVASDGTLSGSASFTLDVRSLTVHGTVHTPGIPVSVTIHGHTTTTAATDGSFSIAGLTVPYDAVVYSVPDAWAHAFLGLRSPDPVFDPNIVPSAVIIPTPGTLRSTTVDGALSPAAPIDAHHPVVVCVEGVVEPRYACDQVDTGSSYGLTVSWDASEDSSVRIHALQVQLDGSGLPAGYAYAVSGPLTLQDGVSAVVDLAPAATAIATVSGSASLPVGYGFAGLGVLVDVAPNLALRVPMTETAVPSTYAVTVPALSGATYEIFGLALASGVFTEVWRTGLSAGTADLELPSAATPSSPADGVAGVTTSTPLTVAWGGGGAVTFIVAPASAGNPTYSVTTQGTSITLADLAAVGLPLPSAAGYDWNVIGSKGYDTGDLAARCWRSDFINLLFHDTRGGPGLSSDGGFAQSPGRSFTTP